MKAAAFPAFPPQVIAALGRTRTRMAAQKPPMPRASRVTGKPLSPELNSPDQQSPSERHFIRRAAFYSAANRLRVSSFNQARCSATHEIKRAPDLAEQNAFVHLQPNRVQNFVRHPK